MNRPDAACAAVPAVAQSLRIVSYNIHKGISPLMGHNRIHDMRHALAQLQADLVFLQEVQGRNDRHAERYADWPAAGQHEFLAGIGFEHMAYGRNVQEERRRRGNRVEKNEHGNAILSRYPLLAVENLDISDHRFEGRGLLHAQFQMNGQTVHCICAHLGLFEGGRQRQADVLIERIRSTIPAHAPLIIAGDFNDWRNRLSRKFADALGLLDGLSPQPLAAPTRRAQLWAAGRALLPWARYNAKAHVHYQPARSFPSAMPLLRLDRVYLRGFRVTQARVLHGAQWARLSDHAPALVELVLA